MLSIFVCEDNHVHMKRISNCIHKFIVSQTINAKLVYISHSPLDMLKFVEQKKIAGLFFLDIDLNSEIDGIDLAESLRKIDPRCFIVFTTADGESQNLTIKRKVEMMDYIVKDVAGFEQNVCDCIKVAYDRAMHAHPTPLQNKFVIKLQKDNTLVVKLSDIYFFKTDKPHFLAIAYADRDMLRTRLFRGKIISILEKLDERFFRCARDYVVNVDKIVEIDNDNLQLILDDDSRVEIVGNNIKTIQHLMRLRISNK